MHKYKKNVTGKCQDLSLFSVFGWTFLFFSIFENLSSADSKNWKLNFSGLNVKLSKNKYYFVYSYTVIYIGFMIRKYMY